MTKESKILAQKIKDQIVEFKTRDSEMVDRGEEYENRFWLAGYFFGVIDHLISEELKKTVIWKPFHKKVR